uniref:Uncharacterized protein n=1 Tax=Chaetoceros debilis TaxID=122233 RepID=A0A6S8YTD0_9STRA
MILTSCSSLRRRGASSWQWRLLLVLATATCVALLFSYSFVATMSKELQKSDNMLQGGVHENQNQIVNHEHEGGIADILSPTSGIFEAAKNSATGTVFNNEKIRKYVGLSYYDKNIDSSASADDSKLFRPSTNESILEVLRVDDPGYISNHCNKWGVVTTIFDPTKAISRVASLPSWCLIIVPDTKTPDNYMEKLLQLQREKDNSDSDLTNSKNNTDSDLTNSIVDQDMLELETNNINGTTTDHDLSNKNIIFLTVEKQKELENLQGPFGDFIRSTPWNHFCRKNVGYLVAMFLGAQFIFDFDDDNYIKLDIVSGHPLSILPDDLNLRNTTVIMQGANAFNHHPIMGASVEGSWARGFPTDLIQNKATQGIAAYQTDLPISGQTYGVKREVGVIQYLADNNPDIDALHRMSKPLPITFPLDGASASAVLVPTHAYSPYNAQATIHTRNAMFAMLLPSTVPGRVSDIWRGYFAQCIFADTGLSLVFAPPKIVQVRNDHDYLGDFEAEGDLYLKSGKLIEFLAQWDSKHNTVPQRMEHLWIDLYERGYIEETDILSLQKWIGALYQIGYEFPPLKRRFRNVAVMGQFNYADKPSVFHDVMFWVQKNREQFDTVLAAGPFSEDQMSSFKEHSIDVVQGKDDRGFYSPLENQMNTLLRFKDSDKVDGVIYVHDDGIMNVTELSQGKYPFPHNDIIGSGDGYSYMDIRHAPSMLPTSDGVFKYNAKRVNDTMYIERNNLAYRVFSDGHIEDFDKTVNFTDLRSAMSEIGLNKWHHFKRAFCGPAQVKVAMDTESKVFREDDGSVLIPPYVQADFLFVPTKYADAFADAAKLHLKHTVFIECAYNTVASMTKMKTNATSRSVDLCTTWIPRRGDDRHMRDCKNGKNNYGFVHPWKLGKQSYSHWSETYDWLQ